LSLISCHLAIHAGRDRPDSSSEPVRHLNPDLWPRSGATAFAPQPQLSTGAKKA
jgi:hypothetical protein